MAEISAVKVEIPLFRYFVLPPDFFKVRRGPCLGEIQLLVVIITMEDIKKAISEAEKELEVAERLVASKRSALMASVFLLGC